MRHIIFDRKILSIIYIYCCRVNIRHGKDNFMKNWGRCLAACFIAVFTIGLFHPVFSHMPEVVFCIIFSMTTILWRLNDHVAKDIHQRSSD